MTTLTISDPELATAYAVELNIERKRDMDRRPIGLHYGGMEPRAVPAPRTPDQIMADAKARADKAKAYAASPAGQVSTAIANLERLAAQIHTAAGQARAAHSRSVAGEAARIDALAKQMEGASKEAVREALNLQLALDGVYAGETV